MAARFSEFSRNWIFSRYLAGLILLLLVGAPMAGANESAMDRPAPEMTVGSPEVVAVSAPVTETSADEGAVLAKEPGRSFFDILFGRKVEAKASPATKAPDARMDERMLEAVRVAERSARRRSINRCWRFVKRALQEAELVECYPQTALAKEAAVELPERYGFKQIEVDSPHEAPVGAVIVYGGRGAGHVELRSKTGFVSDHASRKPSPRPMIGVFIKPVDPLEG